MINGMDPYREQWISGKLLHLFGGHTSKAIREVRFRREILQTRTLFLNRPIHGPWVWPQVQEQRPKFSNTRLAFGCAHVEVPSAELKASAFEPFFQCSQITEPKIPPRLRMRSEERRVGKECRHGWSTHQGKRQRMKDAR